VCERENELARERERERVCVRVFAYVCASLALCVSFSLSLSLSLLLSLSRSLLSAVCRVVLLLCRLCVSLLIDLLSVSSYPCPPPSSPLCGVATVSRIDQMIGLFCRISSLL